ncbi:MULTISPECIES: hypothetical protein [Protofrankia]|uniref:hypothetical protein n=1 Tax=Protofrankia TaxID=2994361 RepID=UPI0009765F9D|nr:MULTISPECIES: hypothetical protein [Protofrankia]
MDTPSDLERSRLLLVWLQARRAVDRCLSDLLAAGPAGERRVREQLELVNDLESRAREAFVQYRSAVLQPLPDTDPADALDTAGVVDWTVPLDAAGRPRLGVVRTDQPGPDPERDQVTGTAPNTVDSGPVPGPGTGTGTDLGRSASRSGTDLGRTASGSTSTTRTGPPTDSACPGSPAATSPAGGTSGPPTGSPTGITGATGTAAGRPSSAPSAPPAPPARPSGSLPSAPLPSARVIPFAGRDRETDITRRTRAIRGSQRRHR